MIRTLLIDNHDSFTWNLVHDLTRINGVAPVVVPNDWDGWATSGLELLDTVDNLVISPGPGTPENPGDVGICSAAVRAAVARGTPVLGICLGHQLIAHMYGATVGPATEPVHGRLSRVTHNGNGLFHGLPVPFDVVRYHSLAVTDVPDAVQVTAHSADGTVMGISVPDEHLWGVQFHPESVMSSHGRDILGNFADLTRTHGRQRRVRDRVVPLAGMRTDTRALSEVVFEHLYGDAPHAVWLDGNRDDDPRARFSIMGASDTVVTADVAAGTVELRREGETTTETGDILSWLQHDLARWRVAGVSPCDFELGWVGYLGYGIKADCCDGEGAANRHAPPVPDAALLFLDRAIVFDHREREVHLLALDGEAGASWQQATEATLAGLVTGRPRERTGDRHLEVRLHDRDEYTGKVREIQRLIRAGETYEACLTTTLTAEMTPADAGPDDTFDLYRRLRRDNPAPFASYLRLPGVTVMSTSPERFLSVDAHGTVTSSPIKGTRPVGGSEEDDARIRAELQSCEKDRAENLMIVDLVRHDIGRIAAPGSVQVLELFGVESYATVHQLVSTVTADLAVDCDGVDAVRAAFPPGSMTGAPKERTLRILEEIEDAPRGVYSGAIGYFSLDGAVDLAVVIRTLVAEGEGDGMRLSYGVGGAVVSQSTPDGEYEETVVKTAPVRRLSASLGDHDPR